MVESAGNYEPGALEAFAAKARAYVDENWEAIVADIDALVSIPSVEDRSAAAEPDAPYGPGPREALTAALQMAERLGFDAHDVEGRIGYADLSGETDTQIGIIGHVDVVPAGPAWTFEPFAVTRKDGYLIGRGVMDDKGPSVVALHAMKMLAEAGVPRPYTVRFLFGANEETGMADVAYYRERFADPAFLFTPDADFPVCNGEKGGIQGWLESAPVTDGRLVELAGGMAANAVPGVAHAVVRVGEGEGVLPCAERLTFEDGGMLEATLEADGCLRIEAQGKSAHASLPHLGVNAASLVVDYLLDRDLVSAQERVFLEAARKLLSHTDGSGVGLACADEHFGALTIVGGVIKLEEGRLRLSFDSRYPTCITADRIEDAMRALAESAGGSVSVGHIMEPFLVDAQAPAIQAMLRAYNQVTGEGAKPFTMGGATYAREFTAGASFGPAMPWLEMPEWAGGIHAPNEAASEEVLKTAFCAYACALFELMRIDLG
ncbi:MAG: Sapep family Mn(2+)-dependent dipeptidase [Eggerthellaceae bacterium]|nr:Sapep family Mn(2+)-dependent dipeptidase [Eggerthellaceae bacterium]